MKQLFHRVFKTLLKILIVFKSSCVPSAKWKLKTKQEVIHKVFCLFDWLNSYLFYLAIKMYAIICPLFSFGYNHFKSTISCIF